MNNTTYIEKKRISLGQRFSDLVHALLHLKYHYSSRKGNFYDRGGFGKKGLLFRLF